MARYNIVFSVVFVALIVGSEAAMHIKKISMQKQSLESHLKQQLNPGQPHSPAAPQHSAAIHSLNPNKPGVDLCPVCVDFMNEAINQLLNIILQIGIGGGCSSICSYLNGQAEQAVCMLICEYVGVTEFGNIIQYEDPDPIFICEEFDLCTVYAGGAANITKTTISPPYGPEGTTFTLTMYYTVKKHTSPGLLSVFINPPNGFPLAGQNFVEGQTPGSYVVGWSCETQPNEDDSFSPGVYPVTFAVCEGDCTTAHNWGGVYSETESSFKITG